MWFWPSSSEFRHLNKRLDFIMADLAALNAAVADLVAEVASAVTALDDLAAKVAAGGGVTQADIDAVSAQLTTANTSLATAVATDDPPVAPAV